jgi:hypothetical protein
VKFGRSIINFEFGLKYYTCEIIQNASEYASYLARSIMYLYLNLIYEWYICIYRYIILDFFENYYRHTHSRSQTRSYTRRGPDILYSQDSISKQFSCGIRYIGDTLDQLLIDSSYIQRIPNIQVVERNGTLFSMDNRRLWVFKIFLAC